MSSSIGTQLAQAGLKSMYTPGIATVQDQCRVGLTYDKDIRDQSPDGMERLVAQTSLNAYNGVQDAYSGCSVLNKALSAVQNGVSGPAGPALARLGTDTMYSGKMATVQDQCSVGLAYAKGVRDNGNSAESVMARTVLNAYSSTQDAYSAVGVLKAGLNAVAGGLGGPLGAALAAVGQNAMHSSSVATVQDQCRIGLVFAKAVRDNTSDSTTRTLAQAALQSYDRVNDAYSGEEILNNFLKNAK